MASNSSQLNIFETLIPVFIDGYWALHSLLFGKSDARLIGIIFIRSKLFVESLEDLTPSKEYPRLVGVSRKEGSTTHYYKLPVGLTFEQIEQKADIFKSAFNLKDVSITKLKDNLKDSSNYYSKAHFSITIKDRK